jgi:hypothetical protein
MGDEHFHFQVEIHPLFLRELNRQFKPNSKNDEKGAK